MGAKTRLKELIDAHVLAQCKVTACLSTDAAAPILKEAANESDIAYRTLSEFLNHALISVGKELPSDHQQPEE